jgi:hypothetical protein
MFTRGFFCVKEKKAADYFLKMNFALLMKIMKNSYENCAGCHSQVAIKFSLSMVWAKKIFKAFLRIAYCDLWKSRT